MILIAAKVLVVGVAAIIAVPGPFFRCIFLDSIGISQL
jgi:hypothetical protein